MRLSYVFIVFFFISYLGFCQEIEKGQVLKDRQFLIDKTELSANDSLGNFVSIRPHSINGSLRNYFVEFYKNLDFTERIEIETQDNTDILKTFLHNGKSYVFIKEKNGKTISLVLNSIDLNTKKTSRHLLYSVSKNDEASVFKALKNNFFIKLDVASKITLSFPVLNTKANYAIVKIFSENLELKHTFNIFPEETKSYENIQFLTTTFVNNKLYTLFQINNSESDNFYKLIETKGDKTRSLKIQIPAKSYELINSKIKDNRFIISGIFSNVKKGGYRGFTYYNINLDSFTLTTSKQSLFQNEKAEAYFSGFFKGNRSIDIKDIFINNALDTYIVGQFYIKRKQTLPVGIPIVSFTFSGFAGYITINPISTSYKVYDDLLIGKINSNGTLEWDNLLQLRQTEKITSKSNKRDASTFTFFANNQINILINGFIEEKKGQLIVKQDKRPKKTNFYNITVNPHGGISQNIMFSNADSETIFRAEKAVKSNTIIHVLGQGNMRKQLLKLKF